MTERMVTDEQVETAQRKWFKDEVTWDKGMAPWTADQFRVEMRVTLEAALTLPSASEEKPYAWEWEQHIHDYMGGWERKLDRYDPRTRTYIKPEDIRDVKPLYTHPSPSASEAQVRVKALEWREHPNAFPAPTWSAQTPFGFYNIEELSASDSPAFEVRLHAHHLISVKDSLDEAKAAAQRDFERRILSCLSTPEQGETPPSPETHVVPADLRKRTFAVQHNPNCPSPWLVRLPGRGGMIDMKPYSDQLGLVRHQTGDILGFGKTFDEAARAAIASEGSDDE